jgi:hypothetical protein
MTESRRRLADALAELGELRKASHTDGPRVIRAAGRAFHDVADEIEATVGRIEALDRLGMAAHKNGALK